MERKYEMLTKKEIVEVDDREIECYRIRALKDIPERKIKKGDLGGLIENESNLSHLGNCWIDDDSAVFDKARVSGDAYVGSNSHIFENARVFDNVIIEDGYIHGNAVVCGNAYIGELVGITGNAVVCGNAYLSGDVWIGYDSVISEDDSLGDGTDIGFFPNKCKECHLRYDCCQPIQKKKQNCFGEDDLKCILDDTQ